MWIKSKELYQNQLYFALFHLPKNTPQSFWLTDVHKLSDFNVSGKVSTLIKLFPYPLPPKQSETGQV